jgi:hypothetical protein
MTIKEMVESGKYLVDLEEPTPLEKKRELIDDVKLNFYSDCLLQEVPLITLDFAWELAEDVNGEDEALNSLFLFSVINYVEKLEEFVRERTNEM